ncbi:MAG: sugar transferase [Gammaproteobacteria bacterium]|nr:sugar transferase [Gammaproteobacteria bacterium]
MLAKRIFDLILVIPGLLFLSPLFLILALWIKTDSTGPFFFRQERVGKSGRLFQIYKFRTMVFNAESMGARVTVGQDSRITRSGKVLRKYKLDELPQLLNVLKGEMSLVGPRPEVPEYVVHWPEDVRDLVLSVPPGITDFASIEFRNENELLEGVSDPVDEYIRKITPIKLNYYSRYVKERSLTVDISLIFNTLVAIFSK